MAINKNTTAKKSSFLKRGSDAQEHLAQAEAKDELRKSQQGKIRRFFITDKNLGDDFRITFLDGDLTPDKGMLDVPIWDEHTLTWQGSMQHFVAPDPADGPDPIEEFTGKSAATVFGLTIIDHTGYTDRKGKVWNNQRRLFVGKRRTLNQLVKIAQKRGGLVGCTFDISRSSGDVASVGDMFEFVEKNALEDLAAEYGEETCTPADWEEELQAYSADELREMGFGAKAGSKVGGGKPSSEYAQNL